LTISNATLDFRKFQTWSYRGAPVCRQ